MIAVADQDLGIANEEQSRIFDRFYCRKDQRNLQGTRIGLAIVREIMDAHGQKIWVFHPGKFCFRLPVARQGSCR